VKLFRKPNSKFYWYDFTVRGSRYRGSTQETKSIRALQVASLRLASVMECTDPLPTRPPVLRDFADHFLGWVNDGRLEQKTRKYYRNGLRLLKPTFVASRSSSDVVTINRPSHSRHRTRCWTKRYCKCMDISISQHSSVNYRANGSWIIGLNFYCLKIGINTT
jgi:hypothetical protein